MLITWSSLGLESRQLVRTGRIPSRRGTYVIGSNVASTASEALGEGAHQDVHVGRIHAPVLGDATPSLTHRTYAVGLVQVDVCLWGEERKCH